MDWMLLSGGAPSFVHIPLGTYYNNQYYTNDQCSAYLEELVTQLQSDDPRNHSRRLGLDFVNIINKDLKPMLISCYKDEPTIFRSTVKLLVGITTPIRCLTFIETSNQRIHSSDIICELRQILYRAKEAFLDPRTTRAIITHVGSLLGNQPLTFEETQSINFCLALLRNVLHIPERPVIRVPAQLLSMSSSSRTRSVPNYTFDNSQQNQIVCNLFAQGMNTLLLKLLDCPQRDEWVGTITQVISVLFKGRSAESVRQGLERVIDAVTSESSEEDTKSSILSDDINIFRKMTLSSPNLSTSSKRHVNNAKFPKKKKKRRVELQYTPTEENVSKLLEIFVVDFMQNGYNTLVGNLHQQLLIKHDLPMDEAQFFWLISYFLSFAPLLKLDMEHVKDVLNIEILTYLTWGVVRETEMLDKNAFRSKKLDSHVRRLHRGVTAIREYLQVLEVYSLAVGGPTGQSHQVDSVESRGIKEWTRKLDSYLPAMRDLRQVFLLLLRQYNPNFQDRQYLRDLLTANHLLLTALQRTSDCSTCGGSFDLKEHLKQFCTHAIVAKYGIALEDFRSNEALVNKSIFTFLHHVNSDLGRIDLLLEPVILRPFSKIWHEKFNICEDWNELIQCVVQTFIRNQQNRDHHRSDATSSGLSDQVNPSSTEPSKQAGSDHIPLFRQLRINTETLLDQLRNSGFQRQLDWIQSSLLTTCSAKLGTYEGQNYCNPIACLSLRKNLPCPIVPWTEVEASALRSNRFFCLLQQLGLLPVSRDAGFYPCIPYDWSPDILFRVALIFSPIDQQMVDFDLSLVIKISSVQSPPYSFLRQSTINSEDCSLRQTTQPNLETEEYLTKTISPLTGTDVSSRVLKWVEDQQSRIRVRASRLKGEDTQDTEDCASIDSD